MDKSTFWIADFFSSAKSTEATIGGLPNDSDFFYDFGKLGIMGATQVEIIPLKAVYSGSIDE